MPYHHVLRIHHSPMCSIKPKYYVINPAEFGTMSHTMDIIVSRDTRREISTPGRHENEKEGYIFEWGRLTDIISRHSHQGQFSVYRGV
jgi:hypothetical protein